MYPNTLITNKENSLTNEDKITQIYQQQNLFKHFVHVPVIYLQQRQTYVVNLTKIFWQKYFIKSINYVWNIAAEMRLNNTLISIGNDSIKRLL